MLENPKVTELLALGGQVFVGQLLGRTKRWYNLDGKDRFKKDKKNVSVKEILANPNCYSWSGHV